MRVLVACEFSGEVRNAFRRAGHDAWSCDIIPAEDGGPHIIEDARIVAWTGLWDMMIAHPPCTLLTRTGARWWPKRREEQQEAIVFVAALLAAPIERIAVENPPGLLSTELRPPDQYIHPWEHGHPERKQTGLWLQGLPKIRPTRNVKAEMLKLPKRLQNRIHYIAPAQGRDRQRERSRTYPGIAAAFAAQWGSL